MRDRQTKDKPSRKRLLSDLLLQGREMSARIILFHQTIAARFGLNATDHKCLDLAAGEHLMTPGRLAELTGLTTGAITAVLDRLEHAGFVRRQRDTQDRRKVIVEVLPEGFARMAPLFASFAGAMAAVHEDYTAAELQFLLDYQTRCISVLRGKTDEFRHAQ